ncbi:hypothetical protein [Reinekea sp. G2M2-21]|uniref:hypothetical protein n=1 Tax=Reinekea sp. G2M2-21 TaxID=2788942 RepID=UPI0018A94683|nr:hypothetical protein [Reinekea sp. G2M2-21]
MPQGLPFKLEDYLELLDWTGRVQRDDKRGDINQKLPPILTRLNIEPKNWIYSAQYFESPIATATDTNYVLDDATLIYNPALPDTEQSEEIIELSPIDVRGMTMLILQLFTLLKVCKKTYPPIRI